MNILIIEIFIVFIPRYGKCYTNIPLYHGVITVFISRQPRQILNVIKDELGSIVGPLVVVWGSEGKGVINMFKHICNSDWTPSIWAYSTVLQTGLAAAGEGVLEKIQKTKVGFQHFIAFFIPHILRLVWGKLNEKWRSFQIFHVKIFWLFFCPPNP